VAGEVPVPETRIQIRGGTADPGALPAKFAPPSWAVPGLILFAGALAAAAIAGVSPIGIVIAAAAVGVTLGLTITVMSILSVRHSPIVIAITPQRVSLVYGTMTSEFVERSAVASAVVESRVVRLRNPRGRDLILLPVGQRRDDVLGVLARHGWPTSEAPGGFRRHF
jgi:hypothetical protein